MRIIAGEFKGRRLAAVKGRLRPTSDKVREAIFSILGEAVADARVLDLFAGTGALALEALSRGAREAVLVEDQVAALEVLRRNLQALGLTDRAGVLCLPVKRALKKLAAKKERFDLVFLDPPYGRGLAAATLEALEASPLLAPGALVMAEFSCREALAEGYGRLRPAQSRRYGDTCVAVYRLRENSQEQESAAHAQSGDISGHF
ncbi:MAG: 16S rRNA (guanine(966)-N(2))-methyltransferase RsmD [Desulfobaccales bacterium]